MGYTRFHKTKKVKLLKLARFFLPAGRQVSWLPVLAQRTYSVRFALLLSRFANRTQFLKFYSMPPSHCFYKDLFKTKISPLLAGFLFRRHTITAPLSPFAGCQY